MVMTLYKMERKFLSSFFKVMVHLFVHLVKKVKLRDFIYYRGVDSRGGRDWSHTFIWAASLF